MFNVKEVTNTEYDYCIEKYKMQGSKTNKTQGTQDISLLVFICVCNVCNVLNMSHQVNLKHTEWNFSD